MQSSTTLRFGIFISCFILIISSFCTMPNAIAQEKTSAIGPDKIEAMLLRPNGWIVEWRGNSSGVFDLIFEERGDNIVAKINNAAMNMRCERDVTITSDAVKLDGCNENDISLVYDPANHEYPFKGESPCCYYKLKEK